MQVWKVRSLLDTALVRTLLRTHTIWSKFLPSFYYPYKFSGGRIYLDVTESPMMLARVLGQYEQAKHKAIEMFLSHGKTFIDVGANKGDFSLLAAHIVGPEGRILSFEPAPDNCEWIRRSIVKNSYGNIDLYEIALSNENGEAELHLGEKSGWHSLIPGQPHRKKEIIPVKTRRLDDFIEEIQFFRPIDIIKIDVEGAEMHVLRGARNVLAKNQRIIVLLDIHPQLGVDPKEVCLYLEDLDFSLYEEKPPFTNRIRNGSGLYSLIARRK